MRPRKADLNAFLRAARESGDDLAFVMENLSVEWTPDFDKRSLEAAEKIFWECASGTRDHPIISLVDFAGLLARYLGQMLVQQMGGVWTISEEPNHTRGQPCIDLPAAKRRIYPIDLAQNVHRLSASYPGAARGRPFTATFEHAVS